MQAFPRRAGPPAAEPVTLAEALAHLREDADGGANDAYVTTLITTARIACEDRTERSLITTPWALRLDAFPSAIELRQPPIIAVQTVAYLDANGTQQTLADTDYQVDPASEPGWLVPAPDKAWPATQSGAINAVTVSYTAGYGATAASVPAPLIWWIKAAIRQMYDERGADVPPDFGQGLLNPYRIRGI